ncbi:hypothetical protein L7F22_035487 [Adiantum nelumboides]|nr:hypothetical protein [Adiantum nelumboides]
MRRRLLWTPWTKRGRPSAWLDVLYPAARTESPINSGPPFSLHNELQALGLCTVAPLKNPSPSRLPASGPDLHHFIRQAHPTGPTTQAYELSPMQIPYLDAALTGFVEQGKLYVETYGCQMNVNDLEIVLSIMKNAGYTEIVKEADEADVILINTCAIRERAESKVWQRLNYFKHLKKRWKMNTAFENGKPEAAPKVAVLGCMAERLKEKLVEANKMVDVVCGPDAYRDLPRLLATVGQGQTAVNTLLSLEETYADVTPCHLQGEEKGQGHYNDVSSTGFENSKVPIENVTPWHHSSGFSSICWTREEGLRFSDLLDQLSRQFPEMRFRFTSPHPKDFPDELLYLMGERPNVCKHVHLPAQSGSSRILERMRRGYTREAYLSLVERIRTILPNSSLSSDFIAGFCGESEEDHAQTLSLIKMVGYDMAYMFAYSLREKTHAHRKYEDDVPEAVKQRRLAEVIETFRASSVPRFESQIGSTQLVLVTGPSKRNSRDWLGLNDQGRKVLFPSKPIPFSASSVFDAVPQNISGEVDCEENRDPRPGDYVKVQILQTSTASLRGEPIARTNIRNFFSNPGQR